MNANSSYVGIKNNIMNEGESIAYEFGDVDQKSGGGYAISQRELVDQLSIAVQNTGNGSCSFEWKAFRDGGSEPVGVGTCTWAQSATETPQIAVEGGFDRIEITVPTGGGSFKMGGASYQSLSDPTPVVLSASATIVDGDGDSASTSFSVAINPADGVVEANVAAGPVVLDLDGNGIRYLSRSESQSRFNLSSAGEMLSTAWIGSGDGFLACDLDGDRRITRSDEVAFADGMAGSVSDLEVVRLLYDSNRDNLLNKQDADWSEFGVWRDVNGNGRCGRREFRSLDDLGIVEIQLLGDGIARTAADGDVIIHGGSVFTYADGSRSGLDDAQFLLSLAGDDLLMTTAEVDSCAGSPDFTGSADPLHSANSCNPMRITPLG